MTTCDVAIVGCGPVGQMLAILLGQRGHHVVIVDKWPQPYALPRAVHFDDEISRAFAQAGIGAELAAFTLPCHDYEWRNAAGQTLLKFDWSQTGVQGWPFANMFSQPDLEAVLAKRLSGIPNVAVRRGEEAVVLTTDTAGATLETLGEQGERRTIRARFVAGCDGANSFVREHMSTALTDLGFFYDWLIVDVLLNEPRVFDPLNLQICDPARPVTVVSGGPGRRRWEFMRLPHETKDDLNSSERAWELLERFDLTPENARLERHAVYTFAARWAERWRDGNLLLAGDAAHLMPPFAGQGMCSGIRDAVNLAWKLDFVLSGTAPDALLDTYTPERSAHVQNAIGMSVALGNVICNTDPQAVAARDAGMIAAGALPERILPPLPPPTLTAGLIHRLPDGSLQPGAGTLFMQARVKRDGRSGLFDSVVGSGFAVLATSDPRTVLDASRLDFLAAIGAHVVQLAPAGTAAGANTLIDIDGAYLRHLAHTSCAAVVVRPDSYLFGGAPSIAELPALVDDLRTLLSNVNPQRLETAARPEPARL